MNDDGASTALDQITISSQGIWTCKTITTMTKADERGRLSRRLYVSLPTWEISIWTGSWVFGVGYAIYQLFLASKRKSWIILFKHVTKGSQCGKEKNIIWDLRNISWIQFIFWYCHKVTYYTCQIRIKQQQQQQSTVDFTKFAL